MSGSEPGYRLSPLARADLEEIWRYTFGNWSPSQADRYHNSIMAAIRGLADGSLTGRQTTIRKGYFKLRTGSHVLFFRVGENDIEIMRILHQRMDVDRHL
ncbi:MAG: type II toxin-antitoxin system RelE/ParE family toxin [Minwuia sp.]|nr:type II toxin-antitoxin system RelE/ParE family toxin [Minwuia sp.]